MAQVGGGIIVSRGIQEVSVCGLGIWFSTDCSGARLMDEADDLEGPFQP